ncbi:hypothetical protein BDV95DRAFT_117556 [Massariosphaeria phaeospora]|uniref:Uncharacterized protein n=1 Tax=Massariosphaeria phaeospora TaxID=100035 RepID=A0A7C8I1T8_9PLEO|nr:hypothetical protein BDV95DRAFT_117556 [Massariosphaeria phaeospora]
MLYACRTSPGAAYKGSAAGGRGTPSHWSIWLEKLKSCGCAGAGPKCEPSERLAAIMCCTLSSVAWLPFPYSLERTLVRTSGLTCSKHCVWQILQIVMVNLCTSCPRLFANPPTSAHGCVDSLPNTKDAIKNGYSGRLCKQRWSEQKTCLWGVLFFKSRARSRHVVWKIMLCLRHYQGTRFLGSGMSLAYNGFLCRFRDRSQCASGNT